MMIMMIMMSNVMTMMMLLWKQSPYHIRMVGKVAVFDDLINTRLM